ncbi:MAG: ribose 5-phosphate isomerase B [Bacteroidota bacterium]|nr:ribose 5-phosphate isomerase B [Bacteroidota bacterium]
MTIALAADHAGFVYKEKAKAYLKSKGYDTIDFGTYSAERVDYPDFGHLAAESVAKGESERGVFVCGSGIGISIAANRHKGVRAVDAVTVEMAKLAREHNDANVLAFGERLISWDEAEKIIDVFFATEFEGGRHTVRVEKLDNC